MRKGKRGRLPKTKTRERVRRLSAAGYSYQEIADTLKMKSRQLARYYCKFSPKQ